MPMRLENGFIRSAVARRIFGLFVFCALIPTAGSLWVTHRQASQREDENRRERLRQESKLAAEQVLERIRLIGAEFARTVDRIGRAEPAEWVAAADSANARLTGLALEAELGRPTVLFGRPADPPPLDDRMRQRLEEGGTVLATVESEGSAAEVVLLRAAETGGQRVLAWGSLDIGRIARETSSLYESIEACLVDERRRRLFCDLEIPDELIPGSVDLRTNASQAYLEWDTEAGRYLAAWAIVFITPDFSAPSWLMVTGEPERMPQAQLADLRRTTLYAMAVAFVTVILVSSMQIRRSLEPLERLHDGTRRVADGNLYTQVDVRSGDEFEDLADSFNEMVRKIQGQFKMLGSIREIDRAVLSRPELDEVARTALAEVLDLVDGQVAALLVPREGSTRYAIGLSLARGQGSPAVFDPVDLGRGGGRFFDGGELSAWSKERVPRFLAPIVPIPETGQVVAIGLEGRAGALGMLLAGFEEQPALDQVAAPLSQLADQLGVALANVNLVSQLDRLSLGALRALARTIDANSHWTAGHSERVTRLAQSLATELGLPDEDVERLYRGGLLHDIGKLGVHEDILDAPDKPTAEQWEKIRRHPEIGARILAPIEAFEDIVPIVLCHHEKWNGEGYPRGLAGDDIPLLARVLAVADVYDALTSDRPYRPAFSREEAVASIARDSGTHFDPAVAAALPAALERLDRQPATGETAAAAVGQ